MGLTIAPTLHPAFTLHGNARYDGVIQHDLTKVVRLLGGQRRVWVDKNYLLRPTIKGVKQWIAHALERGCPVTVDIETDGRHPLVCDVRCIGLYDGEWGICVPLLYRDGTTHEEVRDGKPKQVANWVKFYSPADEAEILAALQALYDALGSDKIEGQNFQFDRLCKRARLGLKVPGYFDTMLAHHVVAGCFPHSLGFIGSMYTDINYYKATEEGDAWSTESDEELWVYCIRDCVVDWLAARKLREELLEVPQYAEICRKDHATARLCEEWKEAGMLVDMPVMQLYKAYHSARAAKALEKMREVAGKVMDGAGAASALAELIADNSEDSENFRPGSLLQLRALLSEIGVPLTEETETGQLSTAKEILLELRAAMIDAGARPKDRRIAFLDYLFEWRAAQKLVSTYLSPERGSPEIIEGAAHATFSVHVTPSGRLSSKQPNMQNQPKPLRGMYVAHAGHKLVTGDWDSGELRLAGYIFDEGALIDAFRAFDAGKGPKVHKVNCCRVFNIEMDQITDPLYRAAKVFAYAVLYGAGEMTVFDNVRKEMPDMQFPAFQRCYENFKKAYPKLFAGQEKLVAGGIRHKYLESPIWGRRAYFFERGYGMDSPEASAMLNFPEQCVPGFTRVLTRDGYIPIDQLVGKRFEAWTGKRWAPSTAFQKGVAEIHLVETDRGMNLYCDSTHKLLAVGYNKYEWRRPQDFNINARAAIMLAEPLEFGDRVDETDAYYLGLWISDGSTSQNSSKECALSFCVGDASGAKHGMSHRGGLAAQTRLVTWMRQRGFSPRVDRGVGCVSIRATRGGRTWLLSLGADEEWKAKTKRIPERIWRGSLASRKAFVRGVLDGDGFYDQRSGEVRLHIAQKRLLEELMTLLRTVGVDSSMKKEARGHRDYEAFTLAISSAHAWEQLAWGTRPRKLRNREPSPKFVCQAAINKLIPTCVSDEVLKSRIKCNPMRTTSPYILHRMGAVGLYDHAKISAVSSRRVSVPVYTLSVDDPEHRYITEGFISKNSALADVVSDANLRINSTVLPRYLSKLRAGEVFEQKVQVHDELLYEVPKRFAEKFARDFKRVAEQPPTGYPDWHLPVEVKVVERWADIPEEVLAWGKKHKMGVAP